MVGGVGGGGVEVGGGWGGGGADGGIGGGSEGGGGGYGGAEGLREWVLCYASYSKRLLHIRL